MSFTKKKARRSDLQIQDAQRALEALRRDAVFWNHLKTVEFSPHDGQKDILKILLQGKIRRLFLQCSRNFGKSTLVGINAVLHCGRYPKSKYYIIAPFRTQAAEIYWASGFLKSIIPPDWLVPGSDGENKTELRLRFKNGSYIKLDGADNEAAVRGYKPTGLACDEFQDWKEETWKGMQPNLVACNPVTLLVGTPPYEPGIYTKQVDYIRQQMAKGNSSMLWVQKTIYDNPRIPVDKIEEVRDELITTGRELEWVVEYLAQYKPGGARGLLPQFSEAENMRPIEWILSRIEADRSSLQNYTVIDPSSNRFGIGFYAYNPYSCEAYQFDEIVLTDRREITGERIKDLILEKEALYFKTEEPIRIYDEAAALFAQELIDKGMSVTPTTKAQNLKSNNITLLRDCLAKKRFWIASHCLHTKSDFELYRTNENGLIVKKNDEMVDTALYFLAESGYSFNLKPFNLKEEGRFSRLPQHDFIRSPEEDDFLPDPISGMIEEVDTEDLLWN